MKELKIDVSALSNRHIQTLEYFIAKFVAGAKEHGDLQPQKDWTKDMLGEAVDFAFYGIFMVLDMELSDEEKNLLSNDK